MLFPAPMSVPSAAPWEDQSVQVILHYPVGTGLQEFPQDDSPDLAVRTPEG